MELLYKQGWTASSGAVALAAVEVPVGAAYNAFYVAVSTLATSQSITLQSAQESSGPWFVETSTEVSTAASTAYKMFISGPIGPFVRPVMRTNASGAYSFLLIGVG